ncbi:hypothetical protein [Rhodococcus jostii]|uniref:hypothetical protein n=1 Tax=Rhodococcus jostii TaxID=132919 RepID=UPI001F0806FD|nr:hypothetical protein [Rhodococcus jostii]
MPQERRRRRGLGRGAALTGHGLSIARIDAVVTALRAIVEQRDDLVKTRTYRQPAPRRAHPPGSRRSSPGVER